MEATYGGSMYSRFMDLVEKNHERAQERKLIRMRRNKKVLTVGSVGAIALAVAIRFKPKS